MSAPKIDWATSRAGGWARSRPPTARMSRIFTSSTYFRDSSTTRLSRGQCRAGPAQRSPWRRGAALIEPVSMLTRFWRELFANPNGSPALIRRLLLEHGSSHWQRYLLSFGLMAVGAACTAAMAFIIGPGIDQAYTERSFEG